MKSFIFALVCVFAVTALKDATNHWAVLVAGSNGYWNYRHQADVCHAYQIVAKNGIPADHIIVMAYNDIANSPSNPVKNTMFNKPTANGTAGVNVYDGCHIDYEGADVTPENFIAVLKGDSTSTGGKPVLKSGPNDDVFINFVDHGAAGLIAFPSEYLYANDLNTTLTYMYQHQMYNKLVFYLEACESGSMFANILDPTINIYATTAANPDESSWGTYCPPDDFVNGVELQSCLGDLYSVNWMQDTDATGIKESLQQQFTTVQQNTTLSHVMQYGDLQFTSDSIGEFQGDGSSFFGKLFRHAKNKIQNPTPTGNENSRMIKLLWLQNQAARTGASADIAAYEQYVHQIEFEDEYFANLIQNTFGTLGQWEVAMGAIENINFDCLQTAVESYENACGVFSEYGLKYVRVLANLCNSQFSTSLTGTLTQQCQAQLGNVEFEFETEIAEGEFVEDFELVFGN